MYVFRLAVVVLYNVFGVYSLINITASDNLTNLTTGNDLWLGLAKNCKDPTIPCVKDSIYGYLKDILDYPDDVQLTSFMKFSKNSIDYNKLEKYFDNNNVSEKIERNNESPLEEISRSLTDNTRKFIFTHDMEVKLPETLFMGTTLKFSPRSLDENGTIVRMELIPKVVKDEKGHSRTFLKKIRKFISERLLFALLAILLVIKLLAVKILFILPSILGVVAAKKLILKVLLFLFPALHHFFKLCAYVPYGAKHHIHKHQISHIHEIAHGHHSYHPPHHGNVEVVASHGGGPPLHYHDDHDEYPGQIPYDTEGIGALPYHGNDFLVHRNDPGHEANEIDLEGQGHGYRRPVSNSGPPTKTEIENILLKAEKEALIKSRLEKEKQRIHIENLKLQEQLNKALKFQEKLKHQAMMYNHKVPHSPPPSKKTSTLLLPPPKPPRTIQTSFAEPPSDAFIVHGPSSNVQFGQNTQTYVQPQQFTPPQSQAAIFQPTQPIYQTPLHQEPIHVPSPEVYEPSSEPQPVNQPVRYSQPAPPENYRRPDMDKIFENVKPLEIQSMFETIQVEPQKVIEVVTPVTTQPITETTKQSSKDIIYAAASITYDPFYSPILEKIDGILNELQFDDEPCRERLICSMYKDPERFSPHSNLLSAELSRDSKELQKPKTTNAVVIRFYRYVQAARDGQDKKDCLRLYRECAFNTEM